VTIALREDYRAGYRAGRTVLTLSEARGYEPQTSLSRFLFAVGNQHWFEPFEEVIAQARLAHEGLVRGGALANACFAYFASVVLLLESSATSEDLSLEVEAALLFTARAGNDYARGTLLPYRQLVRAMRGETETAGSFADSSFDEAAHLVHAAGAGGGPRTGAGEGLRAYFHVNRALAALVFGQTEDLVRHAAAAMSFLPSIPGIAASVNVHMLAALALAQRMRAAAPEERAVLLAELDRSRDWLQRRADDAPRNFLHTLRFVEAERAWAQGDFGIASAAFEAALRAARPLQSPWRRALVAERAGLFYFEHGLDRYARLLLRDARKFYEAWGATGKVRQLEQQHPFLHVAGSARALSTGRGTTVSSNAIDVVSILRASQALSSQTSFRSLKDRVIELLASMTGATAVLFFVRHNDTGEWLFSPAHDDNDALIPVNDAGTRGLLPLSAFRYVERTGEPLLLADAMADDRFARDPYFAGCEQCSLLVVPIRSQGEPRAIVLLENRVSRNAFAAGRHEAVMLIAGQLAVSLDNALLYASLEQKVGERTVALAAANEQLALLSLTDPLTGLVNRRGFDEKLQAAWRRALRSGGSLGLAMIDIDKFKSYNDEYGHPAGDACLRSVAATLQDGIRPGSDVAARYGGEEFVLLFPDAVIEGTYAAAERLRAAVAALYDNDSTSVRRTVTISIGVVAFIPAANDNAAQYIEAADAALYQAKSEGRDRVVRAAGALL
jgi:diguanylate cyclase (GGDEF)-like protein